MITINDKHSDKTAAFCELIEQTVTKNVDKPDISDRILHVPQLSHGFGLQSVFLFLSQQL